MMGEYDTSGFGDVASDIGRVTQSITGGVADVIRAKGETESTAITESAQGGAIAIIGVLLVAYILFSK